MAEFKKPEPLQIKCTASDCDNDLHCFKATRKMAQADRGRCRACGADLVDWHRLHQREIADAKYTHGQYLRTSRGRSGVGSAHA